MIFFFFFVVILIFSSFSWFLDAPGSPSHSLEGSSSPSSGNPPKPLLPSRVGSNPPFQGDFPAPELCLVIRAGTNTGSDSGAAPGCLGQGHTWLSRQCHLSPTPGMSQRHGPGASGEEGKTGKGKTRRGQLHLLFVLLFPGSWGTPGLGLCREVAATFLCHFVSRSPGGHHTPVGPRGSLGMQEKFGNAAGMELSLPAVPSVTAPPPMASGQRHLSLVVTCPCTSGLP